MEATTFGGFGTTSIDIGRLRLPAVTYMRTDAMELEHPGAPPDSSSVNDFIQSVRATTHQASTTVGIGEMVRLSGGNLVGAALQVVGCCVHLAAFRYQGFEGQGRAPVELKPRMARSSARARQR
jgi:hypothetical protein